MSSAFQIAARTHPILLVLAGTPDASLHLRSARVTFRERDRKFRIGQLDGEAAFEALSQPLMTRGIPFEADVIRRAAREAQNYPYFLQCWGEALWDAEASRLSAMSRRSGIWLNRLRERRVQPNVGTDAFEASQAAASRLVLDLYSERTDEFDHYGMLAQVAELAIAISAGTQGRTAIRRFASAMAAIWEMRDREPPRSLPGGGCG